MEDKQILNYLIAVFKIENPYIINDLIDDIEVLENKQGLIPFVKQRLNYERFRFLTSFEKLTAMISEFKKENKLELSEEMQTKVLSYSDELFKKLTTILDYVNFELQTKGKSIDDLDLIETLKKNRLENHHLKVIEAIGSKKKLMHLCNYGKEELRATIESIVHKKAMIKQYPQLKQKSGDIKVLERIKNG